MHGDGVGYTTSPYYFYCLLSQLIQIFTSETKFCVRNLEFVQTGGDQTCKMWASDLSCVGMATSGASDWCLKWTLDVFNQEVGLSHRSQDSVLFSLDTFCIYTECCCCSHCSLSRHLVCLTYFQAVYSLQQMLSGGTGVSGPTVSAGCSDPGHLAADTMLAAADSADCCRQCCSAAVVQFTQWSCWSHRSSQLRLPSAHGP